MNLVHFPYWIKSGRLGRIFPYAELICNDKVVGRRYGCTRWHAKLRVSLLAP